MEIMTLRPNHRPLYSVQHHKAPTLRRVLWNKILSGVQDASWHRIAKQLLRMTVGILLLVAVASPQFFLGMLYGAATRFGVRVALYCVILAAFVYWRSAIRMLRRPRTSNQHTFHGVPVDELASYLCDRQKFTRDDAIKTLGISQGKYAKITAELKKHGILKHGENNAHVLAEITREQLVQQLRDKFPLVLDEHNGEWVERVGSYARFLLDRERDQQQKEEKERKLDERIERKEEELRELAENPFVLRELVYPA